ncbi:MAG TPA: L,D-transpeptidase family protein [Chthoniobacteraceae bacterium]|jgi:lipoprotein-anchoring transpeptidase ErfK/SrfK|nr:L,D-transpeptidase family protein [Chthoniobacteraceae bacterium]
MTVAAAFAASSAAALAQEGLSSYQAIVSVADQKIAVVRDGQVVAKYPISTSRFGVGDASGSYKTPLGKLKVCEKLGDRLPSGAVIKHRQATGEVISVNAPGRDPIVTRILWLDGQEPGNARAKDRSIYIHGTPEEKLIGRPASYGCIRMRSQDVIALYNELGVGSTVSIVPDKLPKLANYTPPKPTPAPVIAKVVPPAPVVEKPAPATSPKVLAAIAEAKEREAKAERLKEEREKADREAIAVRIAQLEKEKAAASVAKNDKKPAPVTAKVEKAPAAPAIAKAEKTTALTLAPAPIAAAPRASRKVKEEPRPVVPAPIDQDRLAFLKNREAALASVRFPADMSVRADGSISSGSNLDAADRLKGSMLDAGLPRGR